MRILYIDHRVSTVGSGLDHIVGRRNAEDGSPEEIAVNRAEDGSHDDRAPLIRREARPVPVSERLRGYWKTVSLGQRRSRKCWRRTTSVALLQTPCRPEPDWAAAFLPAVGNLTKDLLVAV
jgi:hypothetical protein